MKTHPFTLNNFGGLCITLALATFILDAPIRYALSIAKLESALYLRDAVCAAVVGISLFGWLAGKWTSNLLIPTYLIVLHLLWGAINLPSIAQPIVALKIYITFLAGIACYESFRQRENAAITAINYLYYITAFGVLIDYFFEMPWSGATFNSAVGEVTVSREWTSGGLNRTAGFGRSSTETAAFLAILAAPTLTNLRNRNTHCFIFYIANMALIALTTTKGAILAWALIGALLPIIGSGNHRAAILLSMLMAGFGLAIPSLIYMYDLKMNVNNQFWWLLSSFSDRINRMWPEAILNIHHHGSLIFGRGLGGIGFPQLFGEGKLYNSADNVMLYIYATFGIPGIFYTYRILNNLLSRGNTVTKTQSTGIFSIWLIYWFSYGLVGNNIDSAVLLFSAGLIAGSAIQDAPAK